MSAPRYALGVIELGIVLGGFGLAGRTLSRRLLPDRHGAEALLAACFLTVALLIGALEFLGTVRLFSPGPIVAAGAVAWAFASRHDHSTARPSRAPSKAALVASGAGLVVAAEWLVPTLDSLHHGIRTVDTLWYHLPWAASFAQSGQITSLRFTDFEYLTAFYPATAEMLHGLGIVLLGRDTLSPLLNLGWLALTLLAAWCVGARRGLGAASTLAAACVLGSQMMVLSQAGSAANDVVGIFFLLTALALSLNSEGDRSATALAALAAGLAIGTKLSLAAPALLLAAGMILASRPAEVRRAATPWLGGLALGGGFWYLRNLVAVGNPFPWLNLPGLAVPAPPLQAHTGFAVARYLTDAHVWSHFLAPGLHAGLGVAWAGLVLAAILAPLVLIARGTWPLRMLGGVAIVSLLAYALTPESAAGPAGDPVGFAFNLRYAAPALVLCLTCVALLPVIFPRARAWVLGLLAALLALGVARGSLWPGRRVAEAVGIAAVTGGILLLAAGAGRRHRRPAAALTLLAVVLGGFFVQRAYLSGRYRYSPGVSQMSVVWAGFRAVHHARVALAGTYGGYFAYPLLGKDDSNSVTYVGDRGPHGSFTALGSCAAWRRALNAGHFDYLVATPSRDPWHPHRLTPSPEAGWTLGDPHARAVLTHHGAGGTIYVIRLSGDLAADRCG